MDKPIDVVCVKHGNKIYDWSYVDKLYRGIVRSFSEPINFIVFTDTIEPSQPYSQVQLPDLGNLEGWVKGRAAWWYKMWLFSKAHPIQKQFIYFDLDTVFVGNCDFLLDVPDDKFAIVPESKWGHTPGTKEHILNSSVMVINPNHHHFFWDIYINDKSWIEKHIHGDQSLITKIVMDRKLDIVRLDRNKIVYWRWDVKDGGIKKGTPVEVKKENKSYSKTFFKWEFNSPGKNVIKDDMSIIIFNGAAYKPTVFANTDVVQKYWV